MRKLPRAFIIDKSSLTYTFNSQWHNSPLSQHRGYSSGSSSSSSSSNSSNSSGSHESISDMKTPELEKKPSPFVILDPRQARVLPSRRRQSQVKRIAKERSEARIPLYDEISELDSELQFEAQGKNRKSAAAASLDAQRPSVNILSQQTFQHTLESLRKGYSKMQLYHYLEDHSIRLSQSINKASMAECIVQKVWGIRVDQTSLSDSALVENIIELDEKVFLLLIANGGKALREWSKSGASISLHAGRRQIIVRSTPQTFQWILAKLSNFESKIKRFRVDLQEFSKLVTLSSENLRLMQRLTDSYFSSIDDNGFLVWSTSRRDSSLVSRLLLWFLPLKKWTPMDYFYDTNDANLDHYVFRRFADSDTLAWTERSLSWCRFEMLKAREPAQLEEPFLCKMLLPYFSVNSETDSSIQIDGLSRREQISKIVQDLVSMKKKQALAADLRGSSLTLTVTPGYLLHQTDSKTLVPNAGMNKTFCTNLPYIERLAGTLPQYNRDVAQEDPLDAIEHLPDQAASAPLESNSSGILDSWEKLIHPDSNQDKVFTTKRTELAEPSNMRLAQIKFVPSPHAAMDDGTNQIFQYPPIEAWCPLDKSGYRLQVDDVRMVSVPEESSQYISMPDKVSDLRISLAWTKTLGISDAIRSYLERISFHPKIQNGAYVPAELDVEVEPGVVVRYLYRSVMLVNQAELEFGGNLLQLFQSEGGKLGGRSIEAALVYHSENASDFNEKEATDTSKMAMDLVDGLQKLQSSSNGVEHKLN